MANISISPLLSDAVCRFVRVSRNIIDVAPILANEQLNLVVAIIMALSRHITLKPEDACREYGEQRIEIHRQFVSRRHVSDITGLLVSLMDFSFAFRYAIPGYQSTGITRLISGVKCENGRVIVTIPGDTVPWLLYCGQTVGFGLIETRVFFSFKKRPAKLLYLYLLSKIDSSVALTRVSISPRELNIILGVKESRPISSISQKYLKSFCEDLANFGSKYQVKYQMEKQGYTGKPGTRPISNVNFVIRNAAIEQPNQNALYEVVDNLTRLWKKYKQKDVSVVWLINEIDKTGRQDEIIASMQRISCKNEKEQNFPKLANTAAKILREDYGINV